jgi:hypothetical protein
MSPTKDQPLTERGVAKDQTGSVSDLSFHLTAQADAGPGPSDDQIADRHAAQLKAAPEIDRSDPILGLRHLACQISRNHTQHSSRQSDDGWLSRACASRVWDLFPDLDHG